MIAEIIQRVYPVGDERKNSVNIKHQDAGKEKNAGVFHQCLAL